MQGNGQGDVTELLKRWCRGDERALELLAPMVEDELRRVANRCLRHEGADHTLQPTALVNEAYLRLLDWKAVEWQDRAHFLAVAAKMMRRILVNYAIARRSRKRGGSALLVSLTEADAVPAGTPDLIALDEALVALAKFDERKSRVVELRYFGGLTIDETANVLGISSRTANREWEMARLWLFRFLSG